MNHYKRPTSKKNELGINKPTEEEVYKNFELKENDIIADKYRIIEKISSSVLSEVYLVENTTNNKFQAIKIFGKYNDIRDIYDFIRINTTLMQKLNHRNIAKITDFVDSNYVLQEMEYVRGSSLESLIYKKNIKKSQLLPYSIQIAEALKEAHENNIHHTDLKPANILINDQNTVKIIDFSHPQIHKMLFNEEVQTSQYLAPELSNLTNEPDKLDYNQQDIFAFGVTLYELLYKKLPFYKEEQVINYKIPRRIRRSKNPIDKVIKGCLYYYPEDRYQSFDEIVEDLKKIKPQKDFSFNMVKNAISEQMKFKRLKPYLKDDYKYLWLALLSLFLILPFYLIVQRNTDTLDNEILIDSPPFSTYINMNYQGKPPFKTKLTKGDHIEFIDEDGNSQFEMIYDNEKKIDLKFEKKKVYLNKRLYGQIVDNVTDLPLSPSLKYVKSKIYLSKRDFRRQKKRIIISLGENLDEQILDQLPEKAEFINLKNNNRMRSVKKLLKLQGLHGLNLQGSTVDTDDIKEFRNLKHLNLKKTKIKRISPIVRNSKLKNLDISNTEIKSVDAIVNLKNIENISVSGDSLKDIRPFLNLPNLKSINTNRETYPDSGMESINRLIKNNHEKQTIKRIYSKKKKNNYNYLIFFLVTLLMSIIIVFLVKILFNKKHNKPQEPHLDKQMEPTDNDTMTKTRKYNDRELEIIKKAIADKRLHLPPKDNALYYLSALLKSNSKDETLLELKNKVLNNLKEKCELHSKRSEHEAVYLISSECNNYFPDPIYNKKLNEIKKKLIKKNGLHMVKLKGSKFLMGDYTVQYSDNYNSAHQVYLDTFKISQTVITNNQFCDFLNSQGNQTEYGTPWYKEDSQYARIEKSKNIYVCKEPYQDFPVYDVSWFGAARFCEWKGGRLPTEAEWEYAARSAGKQHLYAVKGELNKNKANYLVDINDTLWHSVFPVKSFKPNNAKLYEMSGNILEWCQDWYDKYYYDISPDKNPKGPQQGEMKVVRGGAWCFGTEHMKTFYRGSAKPLTRNNFIGFRMVIPHS
ncbi:MAG TPA: SUMF1/EgtB/PvdO family nonheme iron enzyme [Candidatus Cloacimonadota bacterium]|nr:SUMF1/EgtB/PvdO family nonheme iron enzyme [Candidatus Cloacimonadota bacterium]